MASTVNYASKASPKVVDRFKLSSRTEGLFSNKYDFVGVRTLRLYTNDLVTLNDYSRTASANRYGTPAELGDTYQEMAMSQDKSFVYTIDKGNSSDQLNIKQANATLKENIDCVVIPAVDKYRLSVLKAKAGLEHVTGTMTKANIVETIMTAAGEMSDELVPLSGRVLLIKQSEYIKCKLSDQIMGNDVLGKTVITNGTMGNLDSMEVRVVPDSYMPTGTNFLIVWKGAALAPVKIKDYKIHTDPPGVSGNLVEFRMYHDCFVLDTKAKGILRGVTTATA
ncbi:hypothetical protein KQI82_06375 [Oscillibacter sp. MSJ-2]|uniref:Phage major capsid protein n=1 Tax=Dysosmobacter acutus TaxID=2841504 RepID=A0ABS6FB59_9FIRM|nr:hypothetical protein [Dysosmobacter acutus]MBU5626544.1 hypothetical protein [Dysosmobacter acutus]